MTDIKQQLDNDILKRKIAEIPDSIISFGKKLGESVIAGITAPIEGLSRFIGAKITGQEPSSATSVLKLIEEKTKETPIGKVPGAPFVAGLIGETLATGGVGGVKKGVEKGIEKITPKVVAGTKKLLVPKKVKKVVKELVEEIRPELEAIKGKPLTYQEVEKAAKESNMLQKVTTREETLKKEAALLKARQNLAALAKSEKVTPELVNSIKQVSAEATDLGRRLNALKIGAEPELNTTRNEIIKRLTDLGKSTDEIVEAAKGVDFTNAKQVIAFYRKFVKPTLPELIDEYRYINLLSSPRTHIVNAFSNLTQTFLNPIVKLVGGGLDIIGSTLTGKARQQYVAEVPAYFKGVLNSIGEAIKGVSKVMRGQSFIERPDININRIPTGSKILKPLQFIPKLLEAGDVFFRTIIKAGEKESLAYRYSKQGFELTDGMLAKIEKKANEASQYWVFRKALDPNNKEGQGLLLATIDKLTSNIYNLRKIPGFKWFVPFIQTPMNIVKQGIEFSPAGVLTLIKGTNKTEQLAKAFVGSSVLMGAAYLINQTDSTWSLPTGTKERELFYASGRKPYSIRIGDKWISYSKLGPLAYPIAMASAFKFYNEQNSKSLTDTEMEKMTKVISGVAEFFSDQSYLEGIGNLLELIEGQPGALANTITQVPSQLIPLSSLQRWVANIIDPIYRKTDKEISPEAIVDNLKKGIPFLTKGLPAYETPLMEESKRPFAESPAKRTLEALSPMGVSPSDKFYEPLVKINQLKKQQDAVRQKIKDDIDEQIKKRIK